MVDYKPLVGAEILLYASDTSSLFHKESINSIEENVTSGFFITDLSLVEFFQTVTDGSKMKNPYTSEEASRFIKKVIKEYKAKMLKVRTLPELLLYSNAQAELPRLNITGENINDYLIADCMRENNIKAIITFNRKNFEKFEWIEVITPKQEIAQSTKKPSFLPYGHQSIDEKDIAAVCSVLRSDWLTSGPKVTEFEETFARFVGAQYAVAVSNGTAALHASMFALGIGSGDEVIVPSLTFAATANAIVFQGGMPVFVGVDPETLLIDLKDMENKITRQTKAIIAVDYAGQACDYDKLQDIARSHNLTIVADACHSLGGAYKKRRVGTLADLSIFSFHPVKHITTGEGGMITTNDPDLAFRLRIFRNHGITSDHHQRKKKNSWYYEMVELGYNYRITDFQCALGISQLSRLSQWVERRQEIARFYDDAFGKMSLIEPLVTHPEVFHAYHLYVIKLRLDKLKAGRAEIFTSLRARGIGVNVHYIPVHLHPFYQNRFGTSEGLCPVAEAAYNQIISLPIFPDMSNRDVERVIFELGDLVK